MPWLGGGCAGTSVSRGRRPGDSVPYMLSLPFEHIGLAAVVGLALRGCGSRPSVPLLVLGIWWRRLTNLAEQGQSLALTPVVVSPRRGGRSRSSRPSQSGWPGALLAQPPGLRDVPDCVRVMR